MKNYKKTYLSNLKFIPQVSERENTFYGKRCMHCYEPLYQSNEDLHTACNKKFYGQLYTPSLNYDLANLEDLATQVIQSQMAVTGVQAKVSLSLYRKAEKNLTKKLTIVGLYGNYILKPPSTYYLELPELESLTMHLANVCGIATVPHSLIKLQDGTVCYITKRVDRTRQEKLQMEDMCQLSGRLTEDKYKGSHEQVAKLILKYSSTPWLDLTNFYEQVLFSFFTGNADMHLKNFSLLENKQGGLSLSPAYDLVPTALVNPNDTEELALNINAKKKKLKYNDFLMAFENCGLSKKVLDNILELFLYALPEMEKMVYKSFAKEETKDQYITLLNKKYKQLGLL